MNPMAWGKRGDDTGDDIGIGALFHTRTGTARSLRGKGRETQARSGNGLKKREPSKRADLGSPLKTMERSLAYGLNDQSSGQGQGHDDVALPARESGLLGEGRRNGRARRQ